MAKKRQASSTQQQRRAAKQHLQEPADKDSNSQNAQSTKSYIVLRSTLPSGSFIPAVSLQVFAVAYCILLLHGRPSSLVHINALLRHLIYDTKTAVLKTAAGLLLVLLYSAIQLKLWSDRSEKPTVPTPTEAESNDNAVEDKEVTPVQEEPMSLHKVLLKVDLSRLDLPVSYPTSGH